MIALASFTSTAGHQSGGRLVIRWGNYVTVPSTNRSRLNCLPTEMPIDSWVDGSSDWPLPRRVCQRTELPVPAGTDDSFVEGTDPSNRYQVGYVKPRDINASGEITGFSAESASDWSSWRYRDGEFIELRTRRPYTDAEPVAINDAGQIAGRLTDPSPTGDFVPVVWSADYRVTELTIPADWEYATVEDIDEDGEPELWRSGPERSSAGRATGTSAMGSGRSSTCGTPRPVSRRLSTAVGSPTGLNARGSIIGTFRRVGRGPPGVTFFAARWDCSAHTTHRTRYEHSPT